ncbi:hypothetical protein GCM10008967_03530 [Bacillus carboniphilus]|uniref:ABC transporter domain-containing protein n=1 Tax=Bacillus carboniphilus TaxID=86663 RepID=A0ABN0VSL1_9BACI
MGDVIVVENLRKSYGDVKAVQDISFTVKKGEIFGIIGPNGAGKTTTIEILEGLRKRDDGNVSVLGFDPEKERKNLNERIGVQFQATSIQRKMKVKEAIDLFSAFYENTEGKNEIIEMLGLETKMNERFEDLSGGWKQRVTLALATLHHPDIVFLDEPSMGLDPHARREMWGIIRSLRDKGCTIVVTTHYMEEAEKLCDRVAMIYSGQVKALNRPQQLLDQLAVSYLQFSCSEVNELQLSQLPGVLRVEQEEEHYKLYSETLQSTSLALFQLCEEKNYTIHDFSFAKGNLDDLFVHYLKEGESA